MEDIKRYLREGREKGVSDKKLKKHLLDNGFSEDDVESAFLDFDTRKSNSENREKGQRKYVSGRKDITEKALDNNPGFSGFAKQYSKYAITIGKIRAKIAFGVAGLLFLLGAVLAIVFGSASFLVISVFCIIPLGVGFLSRYHAKRAEKYWEEREKVKNKGGSDTKNNPDRESGGENYYDFKKKSTVGMFSYALGFFFGFFGFGWLPALIIYKTREDKIDKEHARRALNWNLSFILYAASVPFIHLVLKAGLWAGLLAFLLGAAHIIFSFVAGNKATRGVFWEIPLAINFVSKKDGEKN